MKHKILCMGDSNTFGYDPRSTLADRYPPSVRWTALLDAGPRWSIVNDGVNGREIPWRDWELAQMLRTLERSGPDGVLILLGTNDLMCGLTPEEAARRMEGCLTRLLEHWQDRPRLLLSAPLHITRGAWATDPALPGSVSTLAGHYEALARQLGISFVNTSVWDAALAFDGVHLMPEGHRLLAEEMDRALCALFP